MLLAAACLQLCQVKPAFAVQGLSSPQIVQLSDRLFTEAMKASRIPGAVVAVVQDGQVLMLRHYGLANVEKGIPVNSESTLFRVASISKTVTATAVMQLWERGQLRLDDDIDVYIGHDVVRRSFRDKITVEHLLTHTAGFDTRRVGTWSRTPADQLPLSRVIRELAPQQVALPGSTLRYADFDFALAGYVVEQVSKIPFTQFIDTNILKPLQMANSGFAFPRDSDSRLAALYRSSRGRYQRIPEMFPHEVPAAGFVTTAHDMARFMIGLLDDKGTFLKPSTLEEMERRHFAAHPEAPGVTAGFFENMIGNHRWLVHRGAFCNVIALLPEKRAGIFIGMNNIESYVMGKLLDTLANSMFPENTVSPEAEGSADGGDGDGPMRQRDESFLRDLARFEGAYRSVAHPVSTFEQITFFKDPDVTVNGTEKGLRVTLPAPADFVPVSRDVFQANPPIPDLPVLTFNSDAAGTVTGLAFGWRMYQRLPWYRTRKFYLRAFVGCIAVFAGYLGIATLLSIAARLKGYRVVAPWRRALPSVCCLVNLVTLFLLWLTIAAGPYNLFFAFGLPVYVRAVLWIPVFGFFISAAVCWRSFSAKQISRGGRAALALVGFAGIGFTILLYEWKLLGFQY